MKLGLTAVPILLTIVLANLSALRVREPDLESTGDLTTDVAGTWRLDSIIEPPGPQGEVVRPFGASPQGLLIYSPNGYVSLQITRDPPATMRYTARDEIPARDAIDALKGYYAYYGRYEVDEDAKTIINHVEGSLFPREVGVEYVRPYHVVGDTLISRAYRLDGQWRTTRWIRAR